MNLWIILILIVLVLIVILLCLVGCLMILVSWVTTRLFESIQPLAPIETPKNEKVEPNPLFRKIPSLKRILAWTELGVFPTPIHKGEVERNGKKLKFWLKREDLCSPIYGGNKVRTLQYQLAACVIHQKNNPGAEFYVTGSGGSNQIVATLAHGVPLGLNFHVRCPTPDEPDMDNTLNLLSSFSFGPLSLKVWDKMIGQFVNLVRVAVSKTHRTFSLGGNSIGGILGQIGGALELAEQIEAKELPDIDAIFLPLGSSCTSVGLILGVCLARHLKLDAFKSNNFKIVSVAIHPGASFVYKMTKMMDWIGGYYSICPRFGIIRAAEYFENITGIDLKPAALEFLKKEWEFVHTSEYVGKYGAHSVKSRVAAALDTTMKVEGKIPPWLKKVPIPWFCGHFMGKSFAALLDKLEDSTHPMNVLLWTTKSLVQPLGKQDEWLLFRDAATKSKLLKKWSDDGKYVSELRIGKIDVSGGSPDDYRHLMKPVYT